MFINYAAIIFSLGIIVLKRFSDKLCQLIQLVVSRRDSPALVKLRADLKQLKLERDSINMMDEFAKYALVDRKINKLNDELQANASQTRAVRLKQTMYIKFTLMILLAVSTLSLIWSNFDKPIVEFTSQDEDAESPVNIFFPFNYFLAFPCTHRLNSIGVTSWMFILNKMVDIGFNKFSLSPSAVDNIKLD